MPGELVDQVRSDLAEAAAPGPVAVRISGVMSLGRGAAYAVESPDLARRHDGLQRAWWSHLTKQDQQRLRAHVTLQNKVDASVARATVESLRADFVPSDVEAPGFDLWRYDGGPWTHLERFAA